MFSYIHIFDGSFNKTKDPYNNSIFECICNNCSCIHSIVMQKNTETESKRERERELKKTMPISVNLTVLEYDKRRMYA